MSNKVQQVSNNIVYYTSAVKETTEVTKNLEKTYKNSQKKGQVLESRNGVEIGVKNKVDNDIQTAASLGHTFSLYKALKDAR